MICKKCNKNKDLQYFGVDKRRQTGFHLWCNTCFYPEKHNEINILEHKMGFDEVKVKTNLLDNAKNRAKKLGRAFDLTFDDIKIPAYCPILGIPLYPSKALRSDNSPSLDRIDNAKGYVKNNVIVCSYRANRIKSDASLKELLRLANFYKQFDQ